MLESLVYKFVENIGNSNNYTVDQMEQAKYSVKIIVYEAIKIIAVILVFSIFRCFKESIVIIFIMSITKPFIGGYHEDTQLKCLTSTLLLTFIIIYLSKNNILSFKSSIFLNSISIFSIYHQAPIINDKMPITKKNLISKNRLIGIINIFILSILSIILFNINLFSQIIVWTILVQAILMFNKSNYTRRGKY